MATALLMVDMQNAFLDMTKVALPNIVKLSQHFSSNSWPRIFTQHGHTREELTPPFKNQLVRKWGPDGSIAKGSLSWEFIPDIKQLITSDSPIIPKNTYDAFLGTDLEKRLHDLGVKRLVVCGVMTDCCCDTTARGAFNRGFETWLVSDATGTANKIQHERGLNAFGFAYGDVITTDEVLKRLK
ncbi:Isochorismatase hydrolase [Eremomyces bilateralis CBS 781.70]|uniref:Isochorismatase hydrolase n=1 Tax=Eremomyces bilateralis CBS 781.70 TaxID=1392243 RepID=A0A6G1FS47_9PEZI|nr:Isochorismatase hydrolase [Eremomyces bilateralis CBS 781.70]KAF1808499.1 Isochorismatase hydrolase [Eremomyces bilateralis CBS 781.70]